MLAIINVSTGDALPMGLNQYEVRINQRVIATFEHDRQYGNAAQCLRDAADAVERSNADKQSDILRALLPMFLRMNDGRGVEMWKDISRFSQGDKARTPKTFTSKVGGLSIVVTRHIHAAPEEWVLTCKPWFSQFVFVTSTAEEAMDYARSAVCGKLVEAIDALAACNENFGGV